MLILARHQDEKIIIGTGDDAVVITVIDIVGDKCRLGISAPPWVPVDREEVRLRKERDPS